MSTIRHRKLPAGWYPMDSVSTKMEIESMSYGEATTEKSGVAAIVPHAGWYFSGKIIIKTLVKLMEKPDLVILIGGHLPGGSPVLYADEDQFETPLGKINNSKGFIKELMQNLELVKDHSSDNSVEIITPFIKYLYPFTPLVWLRTGSGSESVDLGSCLYKISESLGLKIIVIASTDLTHYGSDYNFFPKGIGLSGVEWVKSTNDRRIINKMITMNYSEVIDDANRNNSACSAGAAGAALKFARLKGILRGTIVDYHTSYDIAPADSFVGYTGICF